MYRDDRFFDREIEYILEGHMSETFNYTAVMTKIGLAREVMNINHIKSCKTKMVEIHTLAAAAALISGELGEPAIARGMIIAWAAAESANDLRLLESGKKVAPVKNDAQWATDNVVDIINGILPTEAIYPESDAGIDYNGYLRMMLYLDNREKKLLRMMDLIQLDMKANCDSDFMIRKCYAGFEYEVTLGKGNRSLSYEEMY
jgi:hypothetical protein